MCKCNNTGVTHIGYQGATRLGFGEWACECELGGQVLAARRAEARKAQLMQTINSAGIPRKYAEATLDTWRNAGRRAIEKVKAHKQVCDWVEMAKAGRGKPWLFLLGKTRRGKTGLGIGALKALIAEGHTAAFVSAYDMIDAVKARFGGNVEDYTEALASVDVLMLDELVTEKLTDWRRDVLFTLLWRRDAAQRITIITTAAGNEQWIPAISEAGVARIDENALRVVIEGRPLMYGQDGEIWP